MVTNDFIAKWDEIAHLGRGAGRKVARPQRILHHRVHRSARRRLLQRSNPLFSDVEWV